MWTLSSATFVNGERVFSNKSVPKKNKQNIFFDSNKTLYTLEF